MDLLNILKSKFSSAEPIFDYEIYDLGFTDSDILNSLKKNEFEELFGADFIPCKIFYLVGYSEEFDLYTRLNNNSIDIYLKYFVGNNFEFGYLDGFCSLNVLRLSNQVCFSYKIKSCRAKSYIKFNNFEILPVDDNLDYKLIMCIEAFKNYKSAFDCSLDTAIMNIKEILTDIQFSKFKEEVL